MQLSDPLFISSRLMAAVQLTDDRVRNVLHVGWHRTDGEGRQVWHYVIDGPDGELCQGTDLRSGVGEEADPREALRSLVSFLSAAAESADYPRSENADMFPAEVMAWCAHMSTELDIAGALLADDDDESERSSVTPGPWASDLVRP